MRVDVLVVTGIRAGALRLPKRAAATETDRDSVFVIGGDEAVRRPVLLGVASALYDEDLGGLAAGDRVIFSDLFDFDGSIGSGYGKNNSRTSVRHDCLHCRANRVPFL
jgi:HlyD family secretion protein